MSSEDNLDSVMESKLRENLKWSMIFFVFNFVVTELQKKHKDSEIKEPNLYKKFFKNWKKYVTEHLVKKDLETINSILNSPKNIFYSTLQNSGQTTESTELYQEKYNNTLKKVEEFYYNNLPDKNE